MVDKDKQELLLQEIENINNDYAFRLMTQEIECEITERLNTFLDKGNLSYTFIGMEMNQNGELNLNFKNDMKIINDEIKTENIA